MRKKIASIILAVLMLVSVFTHADLSISKAEESIPYTTADEDLSKADNFDISDYLEDLSDYKLDVIQIALSEDFTDLYIYVYVPSFRLSKRTATSINISLTDDVDTLDFSNYKLIACDTDGVLHKYLVDGISLPLVNPLYINIPSIFSNPYIPGQILPDESSGGIIVEESFNVAKCYKVDNTVNGVFYSCRKTDIVEITARTDGSLRYDDGVSWSTFFSCDSHYVAFSTDRKIEELYEADVSFVIQYHEKYTGINSYENFGEQQPNKVTVYSNEFAENSTQGWWGGEKHTWTRIETVEHFKANEELTNEAITKLDGLQWVLRYCETEYIFQTSGSAASGNFSALLKETLVSEVTILRLKFMSKGIVYNLGIVDDKVTPDTEPDGGDIFLEEDNWWDKLFSALMVIGLIILLAPALPYVFKAIWFIVCLPFKAIEALIKAFKKSKRKK